jgi:hypothetical protein
MPTAAKKEHRFHLRASERDVSTISRAAASVGVSVSAFILESASERAVLVHAIDADAAALYWRFNFEPSPANELHLMLLMKDLRLAIHR